MPAPRLVGVDVCYLAKLQAAAPTRPYTHAPSHLHGVQAAHTPPHAWPHLVPKDGTHERKELVLVIPVSAALAGVPQGLHVPRPLIKPYAAVAECPCTGERVDADPHLTSCNEEDDKAHGNEKPLKVLDSLASVEKEHAQQHARSDANKAGQRDSLQQGGRPTADTCQTVIQVPAR